MSRKLSSLLYTSGEDLDWNEMVGEDKEEEEEEGEDQGRSDDHRSRGDSTGDREVGSRQTKKATPPPAGLDTTQVSSFYVFLQLTVSLKQANQLRPESLFLCK